MGYTEWAEQVKEEIGIDAKGNPVTVTVTKKYYKIVCDNCSKTVVDTSEPNVQNQAYYTVGSGDTKKYYCGNCYNVLKATGEL